MTQAHAPVFGRRGRVVSPAARAEPPGPLRLLPRRECDLAGMLLDLNGRTSRRMFFIVFAATSFGMFPGLAMLAPFAGPDAGIRIGRHPGAFALAAILVLIPLLLQMVQFVRRMHDHGCDTDEAVLLFAMSMTCFAVPSLAGYPFAASLTVIVYFAFAFRAGSNTVNRWGPPCAPPGPGS